MFISLDGVMQGPGGPDEDRDGAFEHGGWVVPFIDDLLAPADQEVGGLAALLLGRKTYDVFAASWPQVGDDNAVAAKIQRASEIRGVADAGEAGVAQHDRAYRRYRRRRGRNLNNSRATVRSRCTAAAS